MKKFIFIGLAVAVGLAIFFAPFASEHPDGLEKVAEVKNFLNVAEGKEVLHTLMPDYLFPGIKNEKVATSVAGIMGTLLVFGIAYIVGRFIRRRND